MQDEREADITLAGLSIWVDGYQFPQSQDSWDGNWVIVRAECVGQRATVELCSPCVHLPELRRWLDACVALESGMADEAELPTMEPYLRVRIDRSGEFRGLVATVEMTPDNLTQFHEFRFPIDASYLPRLADAIRRVLAEYPIRNTPSG
ncbi:MAG: hypothetical protein GC200_08360 [Tepidisphaera sp.]|nr:hypothetical protein [Tepidisphaera sp.]